MSGQRRQAGPTIHGKRTIPVDSGVPPKRRKLEHANIAAEELQRSASKHISVKREPSPTPPPSLVPRTSGTVRINIPGNCRKTQLGWKERRDKWVAEETLKLSCLGLTISKSLIREDGLALDWVSPVPVCPLTLRPLSQVQSGAHTHHPQRAPSKQFPVDPLGHALHDQLSPSYLSNTSGPKPSVHTQADTPRQNGCQSLPQLQDGGPRVVSDFTVVGAAMRKERKIPGLEWAAESISDDTIQWEHRKLLPPDLRPSTQFRYANREGAKDRKARRLVWITKEIEKVEGYTGEKVGGFRYEGDDVIIYLNKTVYYARRKRELARENPSIPPQLDHSQIRTSHAPPTSSPTDPGPTRIISPSAMASRDNHTEDLHPRAPVNLGCGTAAGGMNTDVPIPPSNSKVDKRASSSIRDSEAVIQARGLGFLERYLQLFDSDRDALSLAYTPNATFCLTEGSMCAAIPGQLPQINKTGRSAIVETLKKIRRDRHHSPSTDIVYNIATLDDMSTGGLLLTCEGTVIPVDPPIERQKHHWYFSRIFVLKQGDEGDRQSWPLQIVAERLIIQES